MSVVIDIAVSIIVLLFTFIGIKRGFIKEIISFIEIIAAFCFAMWLSGVLADFIFDNVIYKIVFSSVNESVLATTHASTDGIIANIPEYILNAAKTVGVDIQNIISTSCNSNENIISISASIADNVCINIIKPIINSLLKLLLFIIIFVISKIVISFIGKSLNIFAKLPVIKTANKSLGAAFGFSKGVVIALTLCYSLIIITNIYKDGIMGITSQTVNESFIFGSIIKLF